MTPTDRREGQGTVGNRGEEDIHRRATLEAMDMERMLVMVAIVENTEGKRRSNFPPGPDTKRQNLPSLYVVGVIWNVLL